MALVARLILALGCTGAALVPSALGRSEAGPIVPVLLEPAVVQIAPVSADEPVPETPAPVSVVVDQRKPDRSPRPGIAAVPKREPMRFDRAEQVRRSPLLVRIPGQDIEARVVPVGVTADGQMATPPGYDQVGWYRFGALPGEIGRAVLAGHFDSRSGAAVFYRLGALQPGDQIEVQLAGGELRLFTVRELAEYPVEAAPLVDVFGYVERAELVLITCSGEFRGPEAGYSHRVIVYADPVTGSE